VNGLLLALLGLGVVTALAWPWLRRDAARRAGRGQHQDLPVTAIGPAESRDSGAAAALEEIEFDRQTGKLSDEDYRALRARYERELAARPAAPIVAKPEQPAPATPAAEVATSATHSMEAVDPQALAERLVQEASKTSYACPVCGPRPEPDARFCSSCGRFIRPCPGCGRAVSELGSQFCAICGTRLAKELGSDSNS